MFITVPILSSCLLGEASSGLHITNRFALRMNSNDSLEDAKSNHSRRITNFVSNTQINIMKAKVSLRGVSTPLIEVANFLWYRIFLRIK